MTSLRVARVRVSGKDSPVLVPITSSDKPPVSEDTAGKWKKIANLMAGILRVPAGLIMRLEEEHIEVFLKSEQKSNPYEETEKAPLLSGLYCETAVGNRAMLLVPDARKDPAWSGNPDVARGMISYLGLPLVWPDGEVFGTICVLDDRKNAYGSLYVELMVEFKDIIEQDLKFLLEQDHLQKSNLKKEWMIREIHHRIKNNFSLLISLLHLKSEKPWDQADFIKDIETRIRTFSLVHEKIYKGGRLDAVALREYVSELVQALVSSMAPRNIRLETEIDDATMTMGSLIPLGMLLNELVVNSIRHAFEGHPEPAIGVEIRIRNDGSLRMEYRDNGKGFPPDFDLNRGETLGLKLIDSLAIQMNGRYTVRPGREPVLTFDLSPPPWGPAARKP